MMANGISTPDQRRAQLVAMAVETLGPERAAALDRELAERAWHLWVVDSVPLDDDDEPVAWLIPPT